MASFYTGSSTLVPYSTGQLIRRSAIPKLRVTVRIRVSEVRFREKVRIRFSVSRSRLVGLGSGLWLLDLQIIGPSK